MKLNVAVIFGGKSVEHEISVISAAQCVKAIDGDQYNVIPIYITKQGSWYTGNKLFEVANFRDLDILIADCEKVYWTQNADECALYYAKRCFFGPKLYAKIDVVFPVLHGTHGEDGALQGLLELSNVPYVGCNVLSSAITMDKLTTKQLLQSGGLPTLDCITFTLTEWINAKNELCAKIQNKFKYPLIIKPNNLGSSIGVTVAEDAASLEDAVDLALSMSSRVLIESKIKNLKEINCAVLGDSDTVHVSVCEEPLRGDAILSYQDKYLSEGTGKNKCASREGAPQGMSGAKRKIPADISVEISQRIQSLARQTFINLHCSGVVRIDFLIDQDTNNIYICELNTIPGSLSFYLWQHVHKDFTALTNDLIQLALKRHRQKNNLILSYATNILQNFSGGTKLSGKT